MCVCVYTQFPQFFHTNSKLAFNNNKNKAYKKSRKKTCKRLDPDIT